MRIIDTYVAKMDNHFSLDSNVFKELRHVTKESGLPFSDLLKFWLGTLDTSVSVETVPFRPVFNGAYFEMEERLRNEHEAG